MKFKVGDRVRLAHASLGIIGDRVRLAHAPLGITGTVVRVLSEKVFPYQVHWDRFPDGLFAYDELVPADEPNDILRELL